MSDPNDFRRQVFIEWLCTPKRDRDPATQEGFADKMLMDANLLSKWKREREFLLQWEQHYLTTVGSPERKQTILDTLYRTGTDADDPRHVTAAAKYMELVEGLKPQKIEVTMQHRPAKDLSDEELDLLAGKIVARERDARGRDQEAS